MEQIENSMVVDWWWDEIEYGVPDKRRLKRERETYEDECGKMERIGENV